MGFPTAAALIGGVAVVGAWLLTTVVLGRTPSDMGQHPDGDAAVAVTQASQGPASLPGRALWRDRRFQTLAAGMALGLFAQIGLLAQLFSLIAAALGPTGAGLVMGLATASAIAGRTAFGSLMPDGADRRRAAALSYLVQVAGAGVLILSAAQSPGSIVLGVVLFGFGIGIGNATSLPPLIAQAEFAPADTPRVVALIVATGQATYAFAPAVFGLVREWSGAGAGPAGATAVLLVAIAIVAAAMTALLAGRRPG